MVRVRHLAPTIRRIHDGLAAAPSLRPGPEVDRLFRELVRLVLAAPPVLAAATLGDPEVVALRPQLVELAARGEYELERAWAERIIASRRPELTLAHFPYFDNYRQLSILERSLLPSPPRRVLFIGAGPLPLSALLLAEHLAATVVCLDTDPVAVDLGRAVAARLGSPLTFPEHADPAAYDLVVVAALVGLSAGDKRHVLQDLRRTMAPGAVLLARSAHGLRTLLYPEVDPAAVEGFDRLSLTHPPAPVINSIVLARTPVRS